MAASAQPDVTPALTAASSEAVARGSLGRILASYGLAVCGDPWRCEALLRDLCPSCRREIFWLIAALKENIVTDIKASLDVTPDAVLVARLAHKLGQSLGLSAGPAQWAAETWLEAVRAAPAAAAPDLAHVERTNLPVWPTGDENAVALRPLPPGLDGRWLALCLGGLLCPLLAIAVIVRVALFPSGAGPRGWGLDTAILVAGLGACALAEFGLMRATAAWAPRRRPSAAQAPWALLPELGALLAQPAAWVLVPALWLGEWLGQWHYYGASHDFAFHLGRAIQSIFVVWFLVKWTQWMTAIQGRIAATLVRIR